MHKKILFFSLILTLLLAGCGNKQPIVITPSGGELTTPQISEPSSNGGTGQTQDTTYPAPASTELPQEGAYPPPESTSQESPYPEPSLGQTGSTGTSPYLAPGQPGDNNMSSPMNPIPGEENMTRGEVFIEKSEVLVLNSNPAQAGLSLKGTLPTPCHYLRVKMSPPDAENKIVIEIFSVADPNQVCIQVLQPFETTINLGSFASGTYTIWVNEQQVGKYIQ